MSIKKIVCIVIFSLLSLLTTVFAYFFVGSAPVPKSISWGVDFSQSQATHLGLDWKKTFQAILQEEGVKHLKIGVDWDLVEPSSGVFVFNDLDWEVQQAQSAGADIILATGLKTPRWPECHIPNWAQGLNEQEQKKKILELISQVVLRYKDSKAIAKWQVENEPFFGFGTCPWHDDSFVKKEVDLVHSLDAGRSVIVSDTGELSLWTKAANVADIVGTTMYRRVWFAPLKMYATYPLPSVFYWRKAQLIQWLFHKPVIDIELQAEPWGPGKLIFDTPLAEQAKTMDLLQFKKNVAYAKASGLSQHYLWGAEWWYWMKETQHDPSIWNEAKALFSQNP